MPRVRTKARIRSWNMDECVWKVEPKSSVGNEVWLRCLFGSQERSESSSGERTMLGMCVTGVFSREMLFKAVGLDDHKE